MCGIVGIIGAYQNGFCSDEQDMFRDMLFLDTLRGWDSTGVFLVSNVGNVSMRKKAVHGPDFLKTPGYNELKQKGWNTGMFMVGHNRAATRGTVNDANAHPFVVDDKIILVQNGTYNGSHKHHKDVEVDTEAVAHVIAENDDVATALQKIDAAYALVWYNVKTQTLNMIRNEQRPLYLAKTSDNGRVFASEIETIYYAASRNKVKLLGTPVLITPGRLYSWTINKKQWSEEECDVDYKFRRSANTFAGMVEDDEWSLYQNYYQNGGRFPHQRHQHTQSTPVAQLNNSVNKNLHNPTYEKSMYEYIQSNHFLGFAASALDAEIIKNSIAGKVGETIAIEFDEYVAVHPASRNPRDWFVYGHLLDADDGCSPIVYIRLVDVPEQVAMDLVCDSVYTVKVCAGPVRHNVARPGHDSYSVVTLFCSAPVAIEYVTEEIPVKAENVN